MIHWILSKETLLEWFPEFFSNSLWFLSWAEIVSSGVSSLTHLRALSPKWRHITILLHLHNLPFLLLFSFIFFFILPLFFFALAISLIPFIFSLPFYYFRVHHYHHSNYVFLLLFWGEPSHLLNHLVKLVSNGNLHWVSPYLVKSKS